MNRPLAGIISAVLLAAWCAALPVRAQLAGPEVEYTVTPESEAFAPGASARFVVSFKLSKGWHVNAHEPLDEFLIPTVLSVDTPEGVQPSAVVYPEHQLFTFSFSEEPLAVYEREFHLGLILELAEDLAADTYALQAALRYQACNDKQCAPPKTLDLAIPLKVAKDAAPGTAPDILEQVDWSRAGAAAPAGKPESETPEPAAEAPQDSAQHGRALADDFEVAASLNGYADVDEFLAFIDRAETGAGDDDMLAGKSWWLVLALVLVGGLLLNLTPCVLPLIPINIAIIGAGAQAGSRARGFALGGAYGLGIAAVYGLLGLVVVLGVSSAFGSINASPWFNGAIAALFIVLALAMFDVIQIDFSKYQAKLGVRKNENGSFLLALFMGAVSAMLAGACVAPVVISTILYAQDQYAEGQPLALALPFLLGVGMALPWPLAGAGLSFLPEPGAWMVRVKQAFGVFLILLALYYGHLAWQGAANRFVDSEAVKSSVAEAEKGGWTSSLAGGLAEAKAEDKPVILDFWATWCKNCLVMNKNVLPNERVAARLENYVKIKYQAENPDDAETAAVMERYQVLGLPTYVILTPK